MGPLGHLPGGACDVAAAPPGPRNREPKTRKGRGGRPAPGLEVDEIAHVTGLSRWTIEAVLNDPVRAPLVVSDPRGLIE